MTESVKRFQFRAGLTLVAGSLVLYGIDSVLGRDFTWVRLGFHGLIGLLGLGLMLPFQYWSMAMAVLRDVFGKSRIQQ